MAAEGISRRAFLEGLAAGGAVAWAAGRRALAGQASGARPNIVLVVADDLGWRDTGYAGSPVAKTPALDQMAAGGVRFDYFYSAQQMCSPGRFAILCGRTPFRCGLHHLGATRPQEITIAKALKTVGYATAQFGKWHLGDGATNPVKMGFDQATWSPNYYDLGAKLRVGDSKDTVPLEGDTSVATMNLALEYIRKQAADRRAFFTYVCFGSPHSPHKATEEFKAPYQNEAGKADFWGEIAGIDAAVANLRAELRRLGIADNTLVWFTSDNGGITPQSMDPAGLGKGRIGARTAAVLEWPGRIKHPIRTSVVCAHQDIYPTILEIVGVAMPGQPVLDGVSLAPLLEGAMKERPKPLGFLLWNGTGNFADIDFVKDPQAVWIDGSYKLTVTPAGAGAGKAKGAPPDAGPPPPVRLVDIYADPAEKTDLAEKKPEVVARLRPALEAWQRSVRASYDGRDYARP
jgi:arylsulfatase A-like enzyme